MQPDKRWASKLLIQKKLEALWDSGRLLTELLEPSDFFPLRFPLKAPSPADLGQRFADAQNWVSEIRSLSSIPGFHLEWQVVNHRLLGRNELPKSLFIASVQDVLAWLGKRRKGELFLRVASQILAEIPALRTWIIKKPHQVLIYHEVMPRLLRVMQWMLQNPKPGIYMRQLSLPEIDSKFIEQHQSILSEWFDLLLPVDAIQQQWSARANFAARYGFNEKPNLVRFRILDETCHIQGLSDLSITTKAFSKLALPVQTVFIVENDINALVFPRIPRSLVIFGRGYGFDFLEQASWLSDKAVWYWGDIDTHGFAILNQCRKILPQTKSFLMDENTLLSHKMHWTIEPKQNQSSLNYLTADEQLLYEALQTQRFGTRLRLEQEYISYAGIMQFLSSLG
ncbi:hypothetical protein Lbir_1164 [Legionella birminghamensis]|uniref:Uncharacterized protein conserved in bacteria n=1 Tax=Legionella birminghamensis TaxID=28083 RepID=A0A378I7A9_9GAMM|nr:Wadjet anti-phage system protein JetD domain-containing protein [Legionella birminghamensis]KTC72389.1 hypothetical protein Lbir_1164 [Legionella birminghamensis]STX30521.1 Uncharacterized protein conserved in bacteria [Legionella birminghamensis]